MWGPSSTGLNLSTIEVIRIIQIDQNFCRLKTLDKLSIFSTYSEAHFLFCSAEPSSPWAGKVLRVSESPRTCGVD